MSSQYDYDVLYLGSGHGTFDGAIPLAQSGKKVAVIEEEKIGGTCPNYGCNAKITLDAPVVLQRLSEQLQKEAPGKLAIDWTQNVAHKQDVIAGLPGMIENLLKTAGVTLFHGKGILKDAHRVAIDNQVASAEKIVIATGLHPHRLDIPGQQLAHDSRDFMDLQELPKKIAIFGAGYIAMEFATIANAAGAKVTVLMHEDKALRKFYQPHVQKVIDDLTARGVSFVPNAQISAITKNEAGYWVKYGDHASLKTDWVLDATGRDPNVANLGLEKVGVRYDKDGIQVDDHLRTTVPSIYASGDVIAKPQPQSTPTAVFESTYLFNLFAGNSTTAIQYPVIPSVVFTSPRIAQVGVSPSQAAQKGDQVQHQDLSQDWYRQVNNEKIAAQAFVFNHDHQLVGASEVSDQAENVINSLLPAVQFKWTAEQLKQLVYLFPTIQYATWGEL